MKATHIILTRDNGERIELTVDEARSLWVELGRALGMQPSPPFVINPGPIPGTMNPLPNQWQPLPPWWVTQPGTADPLPPPYVITCEVRQ